MTSDETIAVVIGGETIAVPILNFAALKRAWPAIRALPGEVDLIGQASRVIEILAAALMATRPELTAGEIERRLRADEIAGLVAAAPRLLDLSGLIPRGEAVPGEAAAGQG